MYRFGLSANVYACIGSTPAFSLCMRLLEVVFWCGNDGGVGLGLPIIIFVLLLPLLCCNWVAPCISVQMHFAAGCNPVKNNRVSLNLTSGGHTHTQSRTHVFNERTVNWRDGDVWIHSQCNQLQRNELRSQVLCEFETILFCRPKQTALISSTRNKCLKRILTTMPPYLVRV